MIEVKYSKDDFNYLYLRTTHKHFLRLQDRLSARVKNYYFIPSYQSGLWDGKIRFLFSNGKFYRGLVWEVLKYAKEWNEEVKIDKSIFLSNLNTEYKLQLKTTLWKEQEEAYKEIVKYNFGLVKMPTGSGKTLVELALADRFFHLTNEKIAIIVPRSSLVEQFYDRFMQFAPDDMKAEVGRFYGMRKELKRITIFTWQSLLSLIKRKGAEELKDFGVVIFDEVHFAKAKEIKNVVLKFIGAKYRYGFTATLPYNDKAFLMTIKALFGEVMYEYTLADAIERKTLAPMSIVPVVLEWDAYPHGLTYQEYEQLVAEREFRYDTLEKIVQKHKGKNVLILVRFIDVGQKVSEKLGIPFFQGATRMDERKMILETFEKSKGMVLVATIGVFGIGIDVKNIDVLILFQPRKSEIELIQAIGRGLRRLKGKHLVVYDFIDKIPYFTSFFKERLKTYKKEKIDITEQFVCKEEDVTYDKK